MQVSQELSWFVLLNSSMLIVGFSVLVEYKLLFFLLLILLWVSHVKSLYLIWNVKTFYYLFSRSSFIFLFCFKFRSRTHTVLVFSTVWLLWVSLSVCLSLSLSRGYQTAYTSSYQNSIVSPFHTYHRLNCVSPKFICWSPNPQCDSIWS